MRLALGILLLISLAAQAPLRCILNSPVQMKMPG
jgi:hypothetical protein